MITIHAYTSVVRAGEVKVDFKMHVLRGKLRTGSRAPSSATEGSQCQWQVPQCDSLDFTTHCINTSHSYIDSPASTHKVFLDCTQQLLHLAVLLPSTPWRPLRPRRCRQDATFRLSRLLHLCRRVGYHWAHQPSQLKAAVRPQPHARHLGKLQSNLSIRATLPHRPQILILPPCHVTTSRRTTP